MLNGMRADRSWTGPGAEYLEVYEYVRHKDPPAGRPGSTTFQLRDTVDAVSNNCGAEALITPRLYGRERSPPTDAYRSPPVDTWQGNEVGSASVVVLPALLPGGAQGHSGAPVAGDAHAEHLVDLDAVEIEPDPRIREV